jgi:hypothetical protein
MEEIISGHGTFLREGNRKVSFHKNKRFAGSGICVVDLEQWTGLKDAATGRFRSRDRNLRRFQ